jgi:hypothetical protein
MQIRPEQYEAFRQVKLKDFEGRAVAHLRRHLAQETAPFSDDDLCRRVRECIPRAELYRLTSERQVISFVNTTYLIGEEFDADRKHSDVLDVLKDAELDADQRAGTMLDIAYRRAHGVELVQEETR